MKPTEELLARILNHLAEKFKNQLILKGGILLRLLNSPRSTQDIDYSWVRTKKRTLFANDIKEGLESMEGILVSDVRCNSRGIFMQLIDQNSKQMAKVEIGVVTSLHLPPTPLSTAPLANIYSLKNCIVSTMNLAEAFSHKLAASLERNLMRDLYDLTQMEPLSDFDLDVFRERLKHLEIRRDKPRAVSIEEAILLLKKKANGVTQKDIEDELSAVIPKDRLIGSDLMIRASLSRIISKLETVS